MHEQLCAPFTTRVAEVSSPCSLCCYQLSCTVLQTINYR